MVQAPLGTAAKSPVQSPTEILERSLALEEGKFDMPVAWLSPAHHANPSN